MDWVLVRTFLKIIQPNGYQVINFPKNSFDMRALLQGLDVSVKGVVNDFNLNQNCYFCSVAFLKGMSASALVKSTETMQENGSDLDGIRQLMRDANLEFDESGLLHISEANRIFGLIPDNARFGFAYQRADGSGHMIVGNRDDKNGGYSLYDPQNSTEITQGEFESYQRANNMTNFAVFVVKP